MGQESGYEFEFLPANALPGDAVIEVYLPDTLSRSEKALKCEGVENLPEELRCFYNEPSHSVRIDSGNDRPSNFLQSLKFRIEGFKNPDEPSFSQSFKIQTFDKELNLVDQIEKGLGITQGCDYPCATCGLSKNTCLSCQLDSPYKFLYSNACLESCPSGFFGDSDFSCQECSPLCSSCKDKSDFCTSCGNEFHFLFAPAGKCLSACPQG